MIQYKTLRYIRVSTFLMWLIISFSEYIWPKVKAAIGTRSRFLVWVGCSKKFQRSKNFWAVNKKIWKNAKKTTAAYFFYSWKYFFRIDFCQFEPILIGNVLKITFFKYKKKGVFKFAIREKAIPLPPPLSSTVVSSV